MDILNYIFKTTISLIFIVLLIYIFSLLSRRRLKNFSSSETIKVLERVSLSKDVQLMVITIESKGYFVSLGPKGLDVIDQLTNEEINKIQQTREMNMENNSNEMKKLIEKFKVKDWLRK